MNVTRKGGEKVTQSDRPVVVSVISKRNRACEPLIIGLNEALGPRKVANDRDINVIFIYRLTWIRLHF